MIKTNKKWTKEDLEKIITEFNIQPLLNKKADVEYYYHKDFGIVIHYADNCGYVITNEGYPMNKDEFQRFNNMKAFW